MNALIIGGDRHGEWVDVLDGAQVWVDIRNAANHRIRTVHQGITNTGTGEVLEAYTTRLAVHESLLGPNEAMAVQTMFTDVAMNEFARRHGERQEIPHEPAASELTQ